MVFSILLVVISMVMDSCTIAEQLNVGTEKDKHYQYDDYLMVGKKMPEPYTDDGLYVIFGRVPVYHSFFVTYEYWKVYGYVKNGIIKNLFYNVYNNRLTTKVLLCDLKGGIFYMLIKPANDTEYY